MTVKIVNKSGFENPQYATAQSAGLDIKASSFIDDFTGTLEPGERTLIKTGIYLELPEGIEAQVRPRSGLALKQGVTVLNSPGTIDSDYRGEVGIILINNGNKSVIINHGDRIAQLVFAKFEHVRFDEVTELSNTERGKGGYGSTGQ